MTRRRTLLLSSAVCALVLSASIAGRAAQSKPSSSLPSSSSASRPRTIALPVETLTFRASELPGYALAKQQCVTCHSPEYVLYQPPTSPRAYWQATVEKMVKAFGAPVPADQIPPIVDYLSRTYGAEAQPKKPQPPRP